MTDKNTFTVETKTVDGTRWFAERLAEMLRPGDLMVLVGGLGAGKTTFVQGLARGLSVQGRVTSPTYIVSRVHEATGEGPALVHVDAYRVDDELDLETIDLEATGDQAITVVEWGQGKVEHLAPEHLEVHFQIPPTQVDSSDEMDGYEDEPRLLELIPVGDTITDRLRGFAQGAWVNDASERDVAKLEGT